MGKTPRLNRSTTAQDTHAAAFARSMLDLPGWPAYAAAAAAPDNASGERGFAWHAGLLRSAALWLIYTRQRQELEHAGDSPSAPRPAIVWLPTHEAVETAAGDLVAWQNACETDLDVHLFPPWDVLPTESPTPDSEALTGRSNVLRDIEEKRLSSRGIVLTSSQALLQPCPLPRQGHGDERVLRKGDTADPIELIRWLTTKGYTRVTKTFAHGEAALRGHILDVYPWVRSTQEFDRDTAVRIEFEFDTIQEIHGFDPRTQRTLGSVAALRLADMSPERLAQPFDPRRPDLRATLWEYLPAGGRLDWIDPDACVSAARLYLQSQQPVEGLTGLASEGGGGMAFDLGEVLAKARTWSRAVYAPVALNTAADSADASGGTGADADAGAGAGARENSSATTAPAADALIAAQWPGEPTLVEWRTTDLQRVQGGGTAKLADLLTGTTATLAIWAESAGDREQLQNELKGVMPETAATAALWSRCRFLIGTQSQSFEFRGESESANSGGLISISQEHLQGKRHLRKTDLRKATLGKRLFDFLELNLGDLVVHTLHGICRYMGMARMERDGKLEDYLVLLFADDVKMFVPGAHIDLVQKYVGKGGDAGRSTAEAAVQLSRLGGRTWSTRKARAEKALKDIAEDLLAVQAARKNRIGIIHPPDNEMTRAFDAAFPYTETPDQLVSLADIKADLERPYPMDRLLCGDVGFGKTEVAVRAAFKAVCGGRQVAVLVPTTILAEQHMKTFSERMKNHAVRVEALSRFRSPQEMKAILEDVKKGKVDVVIGTHRLLQKDVQFVNLGLAIVDEEQRFGVVHKEFFKRLRATVDTLTLTATPIPRTLHMSLIGLRDISNLSQPPADRKAVATKICKWDVNQIRRSVLREINRGGQVFFIHNRVQSLYSVKKRLEAILPEIRIGIGHGKMDEHELSDVMSSFINGRIDLLLATTIIESGLDIPNANTMFVDRADKFGLADLHQLRGRVGRSERKAYAYFLIDENLPPNARGWERLKAIEEFDGLGAGFNLAMRDLEIRGAGNILGAEQSGNIADIGYELYTRILEKVVKTAKGEEALDPVEITVDLRLNASFPEGYLADDDEALETYRKLSLCRTREDADDVMGAVLDMSGTPPPEVDRVFCQARLRILSQAARVPYVGLAEGRLQFRAAGWKFELLKRALSTTFRDVRVLDDETVTLPVPGTVEVSPYLPKFVEKMHGGRSRELRGGGRGRQSYATQRGGESAQAAEPKANFWITRLKEKQPATWPMPWRGLTWTEAQLWELCEEVLVLLGDFRMLLLKEELAKMAPAADGFAGGDSAAAAMDANAARSLSDHAANAPIAPATKAANGAPAAASPTAGAGPGAAKPMANWPDQDDDFAPRRSKREPRVGNPPPPRVEPPPPSPSSLAAETLMKKAGHKLSRGRKSP